MAIIEIKIDSWFYPVFQSLLSSPPYDSHPCLFTEPLRPMTVSHLLDNPIWHALSSHHAAFAQGDALARRYHPDVNSLGGMSEQTPDSYRALRELLPHDAKLALFLDEPPITPEFLSLEMGFPLIQMVCEMPQAPKTPTPTIVTLTPEDVPEMLALTHLTQPGPFYRRTIELGHYYGIRQEGRLAAMAGERLHLDGYTEASAVCTHPDFQGHGFAQALLYHVTQGILARGETPFLHVRPDNANAIHAYQKLGYTQRRLIHLAVFSLKSSALAN
jgi:predicted GNAT family acetyltransferase